LYCSFPALGEHRAPLSFPTRRSSDLILTGIDQIWVSDITYYELNRKFYYLTFIMDGFSRRITGHHVSSRLFTEQTSLPALQMARSEEHTSELQSRENLVCRLLLEKKN